MRLQVGEKRKGSGAMRHKLEAGVGLAAAAAAAFFLPGKCHLYKLPVRASLGETLQGKPGAFPAFHVSGCPFYF